MNKKNARYNYRNIKLRVSEQELIDILREEVKRKTDVLLNDNAVVRLALARAIKKESENE